MTGGCWTKCLSTFSFGNQPFSPVYRCIMSHCVMLGSQTLNKYDDNLISQFGALNFAFSRMVKRVLHRGN